MPGFAILLFAMLMPRCLDGQLKFGLLKWVGVSRVFHVVLCFLQFSVGFSVFFFGWFFKYVSVLF